jgi:hypothetical protein
MGIEGVVLIRKSSDFAVNAIIRPSAMRTIGQRQRSEDQSGTHFTTTQVCAFSETLPESGGKPAMLLAIFVFPPGPGAAILRHLRTNSSRT